MSLISAAVDVDFRSGDWIDVGSFTRTKNIQSDSIYPKYPSFHHKSFNPSRSFTMSLILAAVRRLFWIWFTSMLDLSTKRISLTWSGMDFW